MKQRIVPVAEVNVELPRPLKGATNVFMLAYKVGIDEPVNIFSERAGPSVYT